MALKDYGEDASGFGCNKYLFVFFQLIVGFGLFMGIFDNKKNTEHHQTSHLNLDNKKYGMT